jgi:sulfate adenylyltransferase subunit 2
MEKVELPNLYFAHKRKVFERDGVLLADTPIIEKKSGEVVKEMSVRCRTIGDMTCTGVWESKADTIEAIIEEVATTRMTERGGRTDDKRSETSMEDRKKLGYF